MKIVSVTLKKEKLGSLTLGERRALLLLGHASNEINILQKLILMMRKDPPSKLVQRVENAQTLILTRILIGKLHEAWLMFQQRVLGDDDMKAGGYVGRMAPKAEAALKTLNQNLGRNNWLATIRNQYSFHYDDRDGRIENGFLRVPAKEAWDLYLSEINGNSFYYASELVIMSCVMKATGGKEDAEGDRDDAVEWGLFDALYRLVIAVAGDMMRLFGELITLLLVRADPDMEGDEVDIGEVAKLSQTPLPFFLDEADLRDARQP